MYENMAGTDLTDTYPKFRTVCGIVFALVAAISILLASLEYNRDLQDRTYIESIASRVINAEFWHTDESGFRVLNDNEMKSLKNGLNCKIYVDKSYYNNEPDIFIEYGNSKYRLCYNYTYNEYKIAGKSSIEQS